MFLLRHLISNGA